jgi:hypothetical protein
MAFFTLARIQCMTVASSTHNFVECKQHASICHGINLKLCVDCRWLNAVDMLVSRNNMVRRQFRLGDRFYTAAGTLRQWG